MAVNLSPIWGAGAQLLDNSGNVLSGGKIYTYAAGTTTQVATYTSGSATTAHSNPIILNSAGRVPYEIWLTDGQNYKFVLKDSNDVLIGTWDNLSGINSNFVNYVNQQEIQTATAGQTVFNLTTMNYLVGTNSLSVFVDGVNQYGPGAQYAYEETDSNTVTFASGLHVGAEVKFTSTQIQNAGAIDAAQVSYDPPFTDSVATNVEDKLAQYVSVKDFGAVGDGVTDDTTAIQNAIDAISVPGGTIVFPPGTYLVRRTVGVNDHWGLKITTNGITLQGNQATLKRFDTDITANALAYPIIFVGTPDSNTANATENAVIQGFNFVGENTRHSQSGVDRADFRTAIAAKNTKNLVVQNNVFTKIDSSVIYYQRPVTFDYTNSVYYNTTKNYNSKFISNTCIAESHAVAGRALIHAISANGIDGLTAEGNSFEWCDVAISTDTTYDFGTVETNTYIPTVSGWTLGAVKRTGRNVVFNNNRCYNGTEHPIYLSGFEEVACNNTIYSDVPTLTATNDAIKIRSLGCSIVGNNISGYGAGVNAASAANNVTIQGNSINIPQENNTQLGAITVSSEGLSTYIAARITEGYWSVYRPMTAISVCGNSISFPETNSTGGSFIRHIGLSVRSDDASNVNFPLGMLQGVVFDGNSIANHKTGVYIVGNQAKNISITGNSFVGKPFDPTSFLQSSAMLTYGTLVSDKTSAAQLQQYKFSGNSVFGTKYLFAAYDGSGTADFYNLPWGVQANRLDYVQYLKTTNMSPVAIYTRFAENTGLYFMDRTWLGNGLNNSLSDGNSNSEYRYCLRYVSSEVRFYTADDGSYTVLG